MAINRIPHLFLLCFLLTVPFLKAQLKRVDLKEIADKYYKLKSPRISDDGKWISVWKSYENNTDTLMIFNREFPEQVTATRLKVTEPVFLGNDFLLLKHAGSAELLNLRNKSSIEFKNVKAADVLEKGKGFIIQYDDSQNNRFTVYANNGMQKYSIENISQFSIRNDDLYLAQHTTNDSARLITYQNGIEKSLLHIPQQVIKIDPDPNGMGLMLTVRLQDQTGMIYFDLKKAMSYNLEDVLPDSFDNAFSETVKDGESYFLKLSSFQHENNDPIVEIWYGSDNALEEKFISQTCDKNFLWLPKEGKIYPIGRLNDLEKNVSVGNKQFFLNYLPYAYNDYSKYLPQVLNIYKFEPFNGESTQIGKIQSSVFNSNDGKYILYKENDNWILYHLNSDIKQILNKKDLLVPYFTSDNKEILFETKNGLLKYSIHYQSWHWIINQPTEVKILNAKSKVMERGTFRNNSVNTDFPLLVELHNEKTGEKSIVSINNKGRTKTIIPFTSKKVSGLTYNLSHTNFAYVEEDFNLPFRLVYKYFNQNLEILYQSNKDSFKEPELLMDIIKYKNSEGIPLKGLLYYPKNYDSSKKYPMVVHIYQIQSNKSNIYAMPQYFHPGHTGFSLRNLIEKDYFVYLPDIVYGAKGTGLSALDCVNNALNAVSSHQSIEFSKIGLTGFSHGGYQTNFIATHSDRFATYISGAGNSDIIRSYFSFNYNFYMPYYFQFEDGQYEIKKSFTEDKELYFKNNPIHYVDKINAPMLIYTGKEDQNINWEQTMQFYLALKRNEKGVVALFYPNEAHGFMNPEVGMDISSRVMDWWEYFLKDQKDKDWINVEIKKDAD